LPFKVVGILKERTTSLSMDLNRIAFMPTLTMQETTWHRLCFGCGYKS